MSVLQLQCIPAWCMFSLHCAQELLSYRCGAYLPGACSLCSVLGGAHALCMVLRGFCDTSAVHFRLMHTLSLCWEQSKTIRCVHTGLGGPLLGFQPHHAALPE